MHQAVELAAACAVLGVPCDQTRLFFENDQAYRVLLTAVVVRVNQKNDEQQQAMAGR